MNANNDEALPVASQGLLLFRSGERRFALPDTVVLEIRALQPVTPLPFTPSWVQGLVNVGGRILPQASLAALLGDAVVAGKGELLVLHSARSSCALQVDEVLARIDIAAADIQPFASSDDGSAAYVCAEFHHDGGIVLLLDNEQLGALFVAEDSPVGVPGLLGTLEQSVQAEAEAQTGCLVFRLAGERYAMALSDVSEIIAPAACTTVPGAPALVAGITTLREEPLLLLHLARLLGLNGEVTPGAALIIEQGSLRAGLLVDDVEGIVHFPDSRLRAFSDGAGDVAGVLHDDADRVLGLLSRQRLFRPEREILLSAWVPARRAREQERERVWLPHLQVTLGREAFGIPLPQVQRILPWQAAEAFDDPEGRVAGVVNIEGEVLPVLAAEKLHAGAATTQPSAWVVVGERGRAWALAVDEAQAIVAVAQDSLEKIGHGDGLVNAVANVGTRLLSLLSLQSLLEAPAS
jgi:purine-binding chemotaxis protein CheW